MQNFKIGAMVKLPQPYLGILGTVIAYYETKNQYLVRFGASQQLYFKPKKLELWGR